jgi:hypothetical protein
VGADVIKGVKGNYKPGDAVQVLYIPWILRINLFRPTNPFVTEINIGCFRRGPQNHGIVALFLLTIVLSVLL